MKKLLLIFLFITICAPVVFAYTFTETDENGKIIYDIACDGTKYETYFVCKDKLKGNTYREPKNTRSVKDVYINGEYKRVIKEQYGDKIYIKY